jgi:hypothetical protein
MDLILIGEKSFSNFGSWPTIYHLLVLWQPLPYVLAFLNPNAHHTYIVLLTYRDDAYKTKNLIASIGEAMLLIWGNEHHHPLFDLPFIFSTFYCSITLQHKHLVFPPM